MATKEPKEQLPTKCSLCGGRMRVARPNEVTRATLRVLKSERAYFCVDVLCTAHGWPVGGP